jgi:hypothetical protein
MSHQCKLLCGELLIVMTLSLTACSGMGHGRLELDDLPSLKKSSTTLDAVISRYGEPLHSEESGGEIKATYAMEEQESALSNVDGKGFVRGVGGFVDTYRTGSRNVTLVFDAKTRLYKNLQWQTASTLRLPGANP